MDIILRQMDIWYAGVPGSFLFDAECAALDKVLPHFKGQYLLQIGGPSEKILFGKSPIRYRIRLSPEHDSVYRGVSIQSTFDELPFLPESVDVVLLPHVLEFLKNPADMILEIANILKPEGHLIILGFNPFSLWGCYKMLARDRYLPWRGEFRSEMRVRNWLRKAGLVVVDKRTVFFRPPIKNKILLHHLLFLEPIGRVSWNSFGASYVLIVRKKVPGMTLIPIKKPISTQLVAPNSMLQPSRRS